MYDYFCAFIVGVVEGLTEYIPVSSTGHMIIVGHMLGFEGTLADLFDVFIQLGAILSVLVVYREKFTFILNTHHWFRTKGPSLLNLAIAMFPACLPGLVFHGFIKNTLFGPMTVIIGLVLGGIFMIAAEKMHKHFSVTDADHITWKQALKIGLFQCLSLWPGFSRSGSTIAGSLLLGISRKAAADFTFIMAVFPAGLLIYWAWNNILSIAQQYFIMHRFGAENPIDDFIARLKGEKKKAA